MRPFGLVCAGAIGVSLAACSGILGLQEPTVDDTLEAGGGDAGGDGAAEAAVEGGVDAACGANLQTDTKNCGTCGHDCLGGDCFTGVCQPALVTQSASLAPYAMALDSGKIYFTNIRAYTLYTVFVVDAAGTNATATQLVDYSQGYTTPLVDGLPYAISVQNGYFYTSIDSNGGSGGNWQAGVDRCGIGGCTKKTLAVYGINSYAIATSATDVYYASSDTNDKYALQKAPLDFSTIGTAVATPASEIHGLVVDGTDVFYATSDGVFGCTPSCGASAITQGQAIDAELLATDTKNVYFSSTPYLGAPAVLSVPRTGGPPATIATDVTVPNGVATDGAFVYFADIGDTSNAADGKVVRCPVTGCTAQTETVLSTGAATGDNPRAVIVTSNAVYWGTRGGHIWRLAK